MKFEYNVSHEILILVPVLTDAVRFDGEGNRVIAENVVDDNESPSLFVATIVMLYSVKGCNPVIVYSD